jgi:hypothetical protein
VPVLSSFYGISVRLYFDDHDPPHFHARYAGHEALVRIGDGRILRGGLPHRARRLVEEWRSLHVVTLELRWHAAQTGETLEPIEPLP